jgi:multidrug efflux system membrane fusion protein
VTRHNLLSLVPFVLSLLGFVVATGCAKSNAAAPPAPPPPQVSVAEIASQTIAELDELPGRFEAVDEVEVRPRVTGPVVAVRFHEGALVKKGDVLFVLDARPFVAALSRARAQVASANARLALAKVESGRSERLVASGAVPKAEHDASASALAQASADLAAANAAVQLAALDVEYATIRAPLDGRTGRATVSIGDLVAPEVPTPLTTVVSVDPIRVVFSADEATYLRYAPRLRAGEKIAVQVGLASESGFPHTGAIDFVANGLDATTGSIAMRASITNPDGSLLPGLYARVRVVGPEAQAVVVDERAILTDQDQKYVLAVDAKSIAQRKDVALGRVFDGKRVIAKGLVSGDRVIVDGLSRVMPGAPVAIQQKTAAAAAMH